MRHLVEMMHIAPDMATCIAFLAPSDHIAHYREWVEKHKAAKFPGGIPGAMFMAAICRDFDARLVILAKRKAAQRAQTERELEAAAARARQLAAFEEEKRVAREQFEALHPLGMERVALLVDRAIRRSDGPTRKQMTRLRLQCAEERRALWSSPTLRSAAYAELILERGVPIAAAGALPAAALA